MTEGPNVIIVLEGIDGSGKGTQAGILLGRLEDKGHVSGLLKLPDYSTPFGKLLHDWMHGRIQLQGDATSCNFPPGYANALAMQAVMQANKLEYADLISEYRDRGALVLDRYWQSAVAYGAGCDGLDFDYMRHISKPLPQADFNIFIDIPVDTALERQAARGRKDIYENRRDAMERARNSYIKLWGEMEKTEPTKWVIVDGTAPVEVVGAIIWREICRNTSWGPYELLHFPV